MDLVSSLCFSNTSGPAMRSPEPALVNHLFNMVCGQGTIGNPTPFDDDTEGKVVVRSFLLQLLLRFR